MLGFVANLFYLCIIKLHILNKQTMTKELILKMLKGAGSTTIQCKDKSHYDRLVARFKSRGYKQVPYVEEVKLEEYPF